MKVVSIKCKTCGTWVNFVPIDGSIEKTVETVKKKAQGPWSCPGHHVELDSMREHLDFATAEFQEIDDACGDQDKWLAKMQEDYAEVIPSDEMHERKIITSFTFGEPMTDDGKVWTFADAPDGHRYYLRSRSSEDRKVGADN